jgi:hypothetical protein
MTTPLSGQTVGLFGTCGGSRWREPFIARFEALGIPYFNPQVENWTPALAEVEAWHLANDALVLFSVTSETFAVGSLAEIGFSALSALRMNANRFVVLYIDPSVDEALVAQNPQAARDSVRARKLVFAHLAAHPLPNVFVVQSLAQMLEASVRLFGALELMGAARQAHADWRSRLSSETWRVLTGASDKPLVRPR